MYLQIKYFVKYGLVIIIIIYTYYYNIEPHGTDGTRDLLMNFHIVNSNITFKLKQSYF